MNTDGALCADVMDVFCGERVSVSEPETDQVEAFSKLATQTMPPLIWHSNQSVNEKQQAAK